MIAVTHFPFSKSVMVSRLEQKMSSACVKFSPSENTERSHLLYGLMLVVIQILSTGKVGFRNTLDQSFSLDTNRIFFQH